MIFKSVGEIQITATVCEGFEFLKHYQVTLKLKETKTYNDNNKLSILFH